jgi:hypothetical protein
MTTNPSNLDASAKRGLVFLLVLVIFIGFWVVNAFTHHGSPSYCEQLWRQNEPTGSIPYLPDNGHAQYITNCKATVQYAHNFGTNP